MTGAEFAAHLWRLHVAPRDANSAAIITAEFDAAVAALTVERDALMGRLHDVRNERDAARSERDKSNATRESQWKELQAARADAAGGKLAVDSLTTECNTLGAEVARLREELKGADVERDVARKARFAAESEGRAAAEYVTALEAEHEALAELEEHEALACLVDPPCGGCDACSARIAHAAVEALRTVKP